MFKFGHNEICSVSGHLGYIECMMQPAKKDDLSFWPFLFFAEKALLLPYKKNSRV